MRCTGFTRYTRYTLTLRSHQAAILAGLSQLLPGGPYRVRSSITQLIGCLGGRGMLHGEASAAALVVFLVRQAAISDSEIKAAEGTGWSRSSEAEGAIELRDVSSKVRAARPELGVWRAAVPLGTVDGQPVIEHPPWPVEMGHAQRLRVSSRACPAGRRSSCSRRRSRR